MLEIQYKPIGVIHSPYENIQDMPIQPVAAKGIKGTIEVFDAYKAGLKDLDGFSHIVLLYHFHLSSGYTLAVKPFLDDSTRGLFATRAPKRPNNIGLSVVKLCEIVSNTLHIENVDMVNGTPLLDIKPYIPDFEAVENVRIGWLTESIQKIPGGRTDGRFYYCF